MSRAVGKSPSKFTNVEFVLLTILKLTKTWKEDFIHHKGLPDFNGSTDVCDTITVFLLGDGQGEVSIQEISLVLVINVFPPKTELLNTM